MTALRSRSVNGVSRMYVCFHVPLTNSEPIPSLLDKDEPKLAKTKWCLLAMRPMSGCHVGEICFSFRSHLEVAPLSKYGSWKHSSHCHRKEQCAPKSLVRDTNLEATQLKERKYSSVMRSQWQAFCSVFWMAEKLL